MIDRGLHEHSPSRSRGEKHTAGRLVESSRYRMSYIVTRKPIAFASRGLICTVAPNRFSFVRSRDDEISSRRVRDNAGLRRGIALGSVLLRGGSWRW